MSVKDNGSRAVPPPWDAFISYSRSTSGDDAKRVYLALESAGIHTFFDENDIPLDAQFPETLADALLRSRLFIAFADADYFQKHWCIYELQAALAPLRANESADVDHMVIVLTGSDTNQITPHLPPSLARSNLSSSDPLTVLKRVQSRLATVKDTIADRLRGLDDYAVRTLRQGGAIPPAESLTQVQGHRGGMPGSLKTRLAGRSPELWALFHEIATVHVEGAPRSCCVFGAPGTGKSQLAAEFVWRYARRYFAAGVVWIDATAEPHRLQDQLRLAAEGLSASALTARSSGPAPLTEGVRGAVRTASAMSRVLWIIDGVPHPTMGDGDPALERWCPVRGDVTLLCTSRSARYLDVDVSIELGPLADSAAVDLLTRSPVNRAWLGTEEWVMLARWVGGNPQALQILYAVLASGFRKPNELLEVARKSDPVDSLEEELSEVRDEFPPRALCGIAETFGIWYQHLAQDEDLRKAAHLVARSRANPVVQGLIPRVSLARLAKRSWLQTVKQKEEDSERKKGSAGGQQWKMNDLVGSYLRSVTSDPTGEIAKLARFYLGFDGGQRTVMFGMPRGGIDALANVRSVGAKSLEDVLTPLLARAVSTPGDLDAAGAAEIFGALGERSAWQQLASLLAKEQPTSWHIGLYMRYLQGFYHRPAEPKALRQEGGTLVVDAATLLSPSVATEDAANLLAPLLRILREAPLSEAAFAASLMAQVKETRKTVGDLLVVLVHKLPAERISTLSAAVIQAYGESAQAHAAFAAALVTEGDQETAIAAFKRALELEPRFVWANQKLGYLLMQTDPAAAVERFEAALAVQPDSLDASLGLSFALIALHRFDEAIDSATTAIELQAQEPLAWLARSRAKADKGDRSGAQEDLDRALELDPQNELGHSLQIALGGSRGKA